VTIARSTSVAEAAQSRPPQRNGSSATSHSTHLAPDLALELDRQPTALLREALGYFRIPSQ
jgi:hypothetical protein